MKKTRAGKNHMNREERTVENYISTEPECLNLGTALRLVEMGLSLAGASQQSREEKGILDRVLEWAHCFWIKVCLFVEKAMLLCKGKAAISKPSPADIATRD